MKDFLKKLIDEKNNKIAEYRAALEQSNDVEQVKGLGKTLLSLKNELEELERKLIELDKEDKKPEEVAIDETVVEERSKNKVKALSTYELKPENKRDSMEYRSAFMAYCQHGTKSDILEYRDNQSAGIAALGVLLPERIEQRIVSTIAEKKYGSLFEAVKKTAFRSGVQIPISNMTATFHRIAEDAAPTDTQKVEVTGSIVFGFRLGEIRISTSYLVNLLQVEPFEDALIDTMVKSYLAAMDKEILVGRGATYNEMQGIIDEAQKQTGSRIDSSQIISMTDAKLKNWKNWQSDFFGKLPISMRGTEAEWVTTIENYETILKSLSDDVNRPLTTSLYNETGEEIERFKGKRVHLIESGLGIADYSTANAGDVLFMLWKPQSYTINQTEPMTMRSYFDNKTLETVNQLIVVNDGQPVECGNFWFVTKAGS